MNFFQKLTRELFFEVDDSMISQCQRVARDEEYGGNDQFLIHF